MTIVGQHGQLDSGELCQNMEIGDLYSSHVRNAHLGIAGNREHISYGGCIINMIRRDNYIRQEWWNACDKLHLHDQQWELRIPATALWSVAKNSHLVLFLIIDSISHYHIHVFSTCSHRRWLPGDCRLHQRAQPLIGRC